MTPKKSNINQTGAMTQTKKKRKTKEGLIEIARSFSFKKNLGDYQSADFFCSAKVECKVEDAEDKSEACYAFCKREVTKSVNLLMDEKQRADEKKKGITAYEEPTILEELGGEPHKPRTKWDFITEAVMRKREMSDDDNKNGAQHNSIAIAGEREEADKTFNNTNENKQG